MGELQNGTSAIFVPPGTSEIWFLKHRPRLLKHFVQWWLQIQSQYCTLLCLQCYCEIEWTVTSQVKIHLAQTVLRRNLFLNITPSLFVGQIFICGDREGMIPILRVNLSCAGGVNMYFYTVQWAQTKRPLGTKVLSQPGTGFTNISTIFLFFFYLFSKSLLNCF
jgi:hypothetical protein